MDTTAILHSTTHLQQPLPPGRWIMTQCWHELLFSHWPIKPSSLRPLVPDLLTLDTFDGEAWLGIVPFRMSNVHPRGLPSVNGLSRFPELNVRTYVTARGISGVYFFSLDAASPIAVALARSLFHLPYFNAIMRCERIDDTIHYRSHRTHRNAPPADYLITYHPIAPIFAAQPGSLEHWLTERYRLYTTFRHHLYSAGIHHRLWPLQLAALETQYNTMAGPLNLHLPDTPPLLHYAHLQEVLIWPLQRVL